MALTNFIIKNNATIMKVWGGQEISPSGQYTIQEEDRINLISDTNFRSDLNNGIAVINDGFYDLTTTYALMALSLDYKSYNILAQGQGTNYLYYVDQLDSPASSDWAISTFAPVSTDTINNSILVRRFDDTIEEGIGFIIDTPQNATTINLNIRARAQTAVISGTKSVILRLYAREIPNGAVITSWCMPVRLTSLDFTTNTYFRYFTCTTSFASLSLTNGRTTQFELTRFASDVSDNLVGDLALFSLRVSFS